MSIIYITQSLAFELNVILWSQLLLSFLTKYDCHSLQVPDLLGYNFLQFRVGAHHSYSDRERCHRSCNNSPGCYTEMFVRIPYYNRHDSAKTDTEMPFSL